MATIRNRLHLNLGLELLILLSAFTLVLLSVNEDVEEGPVFLSSDEVVEERPENNIFAAIDHMIPLVSIERRLVDIARKYLKEQKRKLSEMAPFAKSVEDALDLSYQDPERYIGNPINCYLLIKRFASGWKELPSRLDVDETTLQDVKALLNANYMYLPSEKVDLYGATKAIIRLMDIYDTNAREIAEGRIAGLESSMHQLTARDCLDIAYIAHKDGRFVRMKEWLLQAQRLLNDSTMPHRHGNITQLMINEYLSWSYYLENDLKNALKYADLVLRDEPKNKVALDNRVVFKWYTENNVTCTHDETTYMKVAEDAQKRDQESSYTQTCRNRNPKTIGYKNVWNLICFHRRDSPVLYLKPMKVTQLHDNPEVYLLHDILSEKQMDELKEVATPRMHLAQVIDPLNGTIRTAAYRVAKHMFLLEQNPDEHDIAMRLDPLLGAVSGLNMETAENLQINNYGLSGQYEFHHDYGLPGTLIPESPNKNRIATLLLYLSNVESGGETVFTEIGLSFPPAKGSALFWYNLYRNGTVFYNTKHASCPVISGSKWVANKWIREVGNEFTRRCSLNQFE